MQGPTELSERQRVLAGGARLTRDALVLRERIDVQARTVEVAFSSEAPVERWWGTETLSHAAGAVRLDRLRDGGPLLVDHDPRDQVGVIESARIDQDGVGRALVRFGRSSRAQEILQDVADGIRTRISVGYVVHQAVVLDAADRADSILVTDWEPLEVSIVAIPADVSVGVGRSAASDSDIPMSTETVPTPAGDAPVAHDPLIIAREAAAAATRQAAEIIAIGEQFASQGGPRIAAEALRQGLSVDEFRTRLLEHLTQQPLPPSASQIGLTPREARQFSFVRALHAQANPTDRRAQEAAAFERECSDAVATQLGRAARGMYVPMEVQTRDLTVGTATAGGHTVSTTLLVGNFIDLLRNRMRVLQMGAQLLTGLSGNIAIPRQTGGATAYWIAESAAPTESQQAFDQVPMSPKTVGAFTDVSRKLLIQSSLDIEAFIRDDLSKVLALAIDAAAITGTGSSNQPTGILATSGIGSVVGGTNGAAPTFAHIVSLWSSIAVANAADQDIGILTNAKVVGKLMTTEKAANTAQYVCPAFPGPDGMTTFAGLRVGMSNQVPSNLTKGSSSGICSAIIAGNWSDLIIGNWGTLDLMVDPYTHSTSGTVRVVALQDVDVAVRYAVSFSAMVDALTT